MRVFHYFQINSSSASAKLVTIPKKGPYFGTLRHTLWANAKAPQKTEPSQLLNSCWWVKLEADHAWSYNISHINYVTNPPPPSVHSRAIMDDVIIYIL